MWFGVLFSLATQVAKVDQINGRWALVERWDGSLVDVQADCVADDLNEGQMFILSWAQFEDCRPGTLATESRRKDGS